MGSYHASKNFSHLDIAPSNLKIKSKVAMGQSVKNTIMKAFMHRDIGLFFPPPDVVAHSSLGVVISEDGKSQNSYILSKRIATMVIIRAEENLLFGEIKLNQGLAR